MVRQDQVTGEIRVRCARQQARAAGRRAAAARPARAGTPRRRRTGAGRRRRTWPRACPPSISVRPLRRRQVAQRVLPDRVRLARRRAGTRPSRPSRAAPAGRSGRRTPAAARAAWSRISSLCRCKRLPAALRDARGVRPEASSVPAAILGRPSASARPVRRGAEFRAIRHRSAAPPGRSRSPGRSRRPRRLTSSTSPGRARSGPPVIDPVQRPVPGRAATPGTPRPARQPRRAGPGTGTARAGPWRRQAGAVLTASGAQVAQASWASRSSASRTYGAMSTSAPLRSGAVSNRPTKSARRSTATCCSVTATSRASRSSPVTASRPRASPAPRRSPRRRRPARTGSAAPAAATTARRPRPGRCGCTARPAAPRTATAPPRSPGPPRSGRSRPRPPGSRRRCARPRRAAR